MPMVQVRIVRVLVDQPLMPVTVGVGLAGRIAFGVWVLVMGVVRMGMLVLQGLVFVLMLVALDQV